MDKSTNKENANSLILKQFQNLRMMRYRKDSEESSRKLTTADLDELLADLVNYAERLKAAYAAPAPEPKAGALYGIGEMHALNVQVLLGRPNLSGEQQRIAINCAQAMYVAEAFKLKLLDKANPDLLYLEGHVHDYVPIFGTGIFLATHDCKNVFLDENNDWKNPRAKKSYERKQRKREKFWTERISQTIEQSKLPIIVAGAAHIKNGYGLKDKLKSYGIELKPLVV